MAIKKRRKLTSFQIIILGFVGIILLGAVLLMLPISSMDGIVTPFNEALFTATSAACVTGLIVHDTATYWSVFGQSLILILIQIGGLGVVTVAASISLLAGRKLSIMQRSTMQEAISAPAVGGVVKLTKFAVIATFIFEGAGALIMMPTFIINYGAKGIWLSFFHSISAFCNAGFDLMGRPEAKFASLTSFSFNPLINIVVMLLIIIGGIGFLTWQDIREHKLRFIRYRMQSKVVIVTSALLILIPAVFYFFYEFRGLPSGNRVLVSLFQAVTPRTAGFNTVDLSALSAPGRVIMIVLMLIGGSPGSTAGGMKTTTITVLIASAVAQFRRKDETGLFGRRLERGVIRNASTILMLYVVLFITGGLVISVIEKIPAATCLFETASAIGTVGLTLGITPQLSLVSQIILIVFMFIGRVGGLTLIYSAFSDKEQPMSKLPLEKITVG